MSLPDKKDNIMHTAYASFEELTKAASEYLEGIGRSKQTIVIYNWIWKKIKVYMDANNLVNCTSETIAEYLKATYGSQAIPTLTHHQKHCLRCALCLIQFAHTNRMIEVIRRREGFVLSGIIGDEMNAFIKFKRSLRLHDTTLSGFAWYLYQFLKYLNKCEIYSFATLSPLAIVQYAANLLPKAAGAKHLALSITKSFLRYLYEHQKTIRDLSVVVPKDNYKKQPRLPSTYSRDEVRVILNSVDRSTTLGKRNYAMLMLAVRLGMRASDISALEFRHLVWAKNTISFNQCKTSQKIVLPLPTDVGESIIDYIKYARPTSDDPHLFLEQKYPNDPLWPKTVSNTANRVILTSGVIVGDRRHGSHALRHTMAGLLLEHRTPLPIISELLGHTSIQTSMCYLRIDTESLRQCALEVPVVTEAFYTQKGGAFYE